MFGSHPGALAASFIALAFTVTTAQAKEIEPVRLAPSGVWQLDMAENKCRIARLFGEGESETVFFIEQWDPSRSAYWNVAGPPLEDYREWRDTNYAFGPGGDEGEFRFVPSTLGDYGTAIGRSSTFAQNEESDIDEEDRDYAKDPRGLQVLDSEGAQGIHLLTLSQKNQADVVLDLGDMEAPLAAMNSCMRNLVEHWGFDLVQQESVQSPAKVTNIESVARIIQKEYPRDALRRGGQADFHYRLTVGEDGKVEDCLLLNQTLAEDFDMRRHPCTAFKDHAEIEPARGVSGEAVRTYYTGRIVYRMGR